MAGEIEKFDPSKLVDQVRERIRNTFAELIPEEEWKKLVQREIDEFLKPRRTIRNSWGNEVVEEGGFVRLINAELSSMLKKLLEEEMKTDKWSTWWDGQKHAIGKELEALIVKNAPEILAQTIGRCVTLQMMPR